MKYILFFLLFSFQLSAQTFSIPPGAEPCVVVRPAYDSDGLRFTSLKTGRVQSGRFSQTDAPEKKGAFVSATQPCALQARDSLRSIVKVADTIYVDFHPYIGKTRVSFSRPLVYVYLKDGTLLNLLTIQKGWAWFRPATGIADPIISEMMKEAMQKAKSEKLGLWNGKPEAPWIFRSKHK